MMNKSLYDARVKICTSGSDPIFNSSDDGLIVRKVLPPMSTFH